MKQVLIYAVALAATLMGQSAPAELEVGQMSLRQFAPNVPLVRGSVRVRAADGWRWNYNPAQRSMTLTLPGAGAGGYGTLQVGGTSLPQRATLDVVPGPGFLVAGSDNGTKTSLTLTAEAGPFAFSGLPPAAANSGRSVIVSDANNCTTPSATVTGGGAQSCLVRSNGTNWITPAAPPSTKAATYYMTSQLFFSPASTSACTISAVTSGNPTTITCASSHGLSTGALVYITGVGGVTGLNNSSTSYYTITVTSATAFTVPATSSGTYTSGGSVAVAAPQCNMDTASPGVCGVRNHWAPIDQTLSNFRLTAAGADHGNGPMVCWVRVNGTDTALTAVLPAGATTGTTALSTGSVPISSGQSITFRCANFGTGNGTYPVGMVL